jgi:PAS domain S-box-containing protein
MPTGLSLARQNENSVRLLQFGCREMLSVPGPVTVVRLGQAGNVIEKDSGLIPQVLSAILDERVNGIALADPDLEDAPIVYADRAFERLTDYSQAEIIGRNCRFLQGDDRDQDARYRIAEALKNHQVVEVTIRNYKKDGALFHDHLKIIPLFDRRHRLIYYLGVQYEPTGISSDMPKKPRRSRPPSSGFHFLEFHPYRR